MRALLPFLLLAGCDTEITVLASACELQIVSSGSVLIESGDRLEIQGQPLTTHFDTAAYIGGIRATVLDVNRDSCEDCDACKEANDCNICEDCDECDTLCDSTCVQVATLLVPDLPPGSTEVQIYNSYGQSNSLTVEVVRGPGSEAPQPLDTAQDSGSSDSGMGQDTAQGLDSGTDTGDSGAAGNATGSKGGGS